MAVRDLGGPFSLVRTERRRMRLGPGSTRRCSTATVTATMVGRSAAAKGPQDQRESPLLSRQPRGVQG